MKIIQIKGEYEVNTCAEILNSAIETPEKIREMPLNLNSYIPRSLKVESLKAANYILRKELKKRDEEIHNLNREINDVKDWLRLEKEITKSQKEEIDFVYKESRRISAELSKKDIEIRNKKRYIKELENKCYNDDYRKDLEMQINHMKVVISVIENEKEELRKKVNEIYSKAGIRLPSMGKQL